MPRPSWARYRSTPWPSSSIWRRAVSSCWPQSQRIEWNTSPVRHSECTRTRTSSRPATSPLTMATWCFPSVRERYPTALKPPYAVGEGAVPGGRELAVGGGEGGLDHALDELVVAAPVGDEVGDLHQLEPVAAA